VEKLFKGYGRLSAVTFGRASVQARRILFE